MSTLEKHKMWLKQALKGFVENLPEIYWVMGTAALVKLANILASKDPQSVENIDQAYQFGADIAKELFGGEY